MTRVGFESIPLHIPLHLPLHLPLYIPLEQTSGPGFASSGGPLAPCHAAPNSTRDTAHWLQTPRVTDAMVNSPWLPQDGFYHVDEAQAGNDSPGEVGGPLARSLVAGLAGAGEWRSKSIFGKHRPSVMIGQKAKVKQ